MTEDKTYKCSMCEGEYEAVWSEDEAQAEKKAIWGDVPDNECDVVCDDCFQIVTGEASAELVAHFNRFHNPHSNGIEACQIPGCAWGAK